MLAVFDLRRESPLTRWETKERIWLCFKSTVHLPTYPNFDPQHAGRCHNTLKAPRPSLKYVQGCFISPLSFPSCLIASSRSSGLFLKSLNNFKPCLLVFLAGAFACESRFHRKARIPSGGEINGLANRELRSLIDYIALCSQTTPVRQGSCHCCCRATLTNPREEKPQSGPLSVDAHHPSLLPLAKTHFIEPHLVLVNCLQGYILCPNASLFWRAAATITTISTDIPFDS